jgi:hypothetical protein
VKLVADLCSHSLEAEQGVLNYSANQPTDPLSSLFATKQLHYLATSKQLENKK